MVREGTINTTLKQWDLSCVAADLFDETVTVPMRRRQQSDGYERTEQLARGATEVC